MLLISCPFCGPRAQLEYVFGGQSGIVRPAAAASDQQWADYLFYRDNPKGDHYERWCHRDGCGLWFNVLRNTVTHSIGKTALIDEPREANA